MDVDAMRAESKRLRAIIRDAVRQHLSLTCSCRPEQCIDCGFVLAETSTFCKSLKEEFEMRVQAMKETP